MHVRGGRGGYAGTEIAAQMRLFCYRALHRFPRLRRQDVRWVLVDIAPRVLPELGDGLSTRAVRLLSRHIEVRLNTGVTGVGPDSVSLSDGATVATHTLVWCAGVAPDPLVGGFGLPTVQGRLAVDDTLQVRDVPHVYALGDAAAVPDLTPATSRRRRHNTPSGRTSSGCACFDAVSISA